MLFPFKKQAKLRCHHGVWWSGKDTVPGGHYCRRAQHACVTLSPILCHCSLTSSTVSWSLILALFSSFFSYFLQHIISTKLCWGRTQQYKPTTTFSLFKLGISYFEYSSLGHMDYSIWGLYLVWNTTSPPAQYPRKVEVERITYCLPVKFLVGLFCPELKGGQGCFSHPTLHVSIQTDRKKATERKKKKSIWCLVPLEESYSKLPN